MEDHGVLLFVSLQEMEGEKEGMLKQSIHSHLAVQHKDAAVVIVVLSSSPDSQSIPAIPIFQRIDPDLAQISPFFLYYQYGLDFFEFERIGQQ